MARWRLRGLAYVLALGFLLLVSLVLSTAIKVVATWASALLPCGLGALQLINEAVSFGVVVLLFVGLMRIGSGPASRRCAACCLARRWGRCSPWAAAAGAA
jgi:membrane protein